MGTHCFDVKILFLLLFLATFSLKAGFSFLRVPSFPTSLLLWKEIAGSTFGGMRVGRGRLEPQELSASCSVSSDAIRLQGGCLRVSGDGHGISPACGS